MEKLRVNFFLKSNQPIKDGKFPILVKVSLSKSKEAITWSIGLYTSSTLQNNTCVGDYEITYELNKIKARLLNIYDELTLNNSFSLSLLKERYNTYSSPKTNFFFIAFTSKLIAEKEELYSKGKVSKAIIYIYKRTVNNFLSFLKEKYGLRDIYLLSLRSFHMDGFQSYLSLNLNYKKTTISNQITTMASIIKVAKKEKIVTVDLFENISVSPVYATDRKFLTEQEIEKICSVSLTDSRMSVVRDCFIFSVLTGLSFSDIRNLKEDHIRIIENQHWIYKERVKTLTPLRIYLVDNAISIINKYRALCPNYKTIFPLPCNGESNKLLKTILKEAGLSTAYTFHCARHSFATLALTKNISLESVSSLLGHTNINTTKIYAKIIDTKIRSEMELFGFQTSQIAIKTNINQEYEERR